MAHALKVAACCLSVALASCGDGTDGAPAEAAPFEQARSQQQRAPAAANLEAVRQLTRNNAEFSHALWTAEAPAGNFFFSPHSISIALAMTYAGAAGTTQQEMATTLHFAQAEPELHRTFNTLDQALAARGRNAQGADGKPFRLRVVNAAWAQHDYAFLPSYLDLLAEDYAAAINLLNFNADPDGSRRTVNSWVDARTEQRIPELLPEGVIDPSTVLVLTNAVYFNASWALPFETAKAGDFVRLDASAVNVPLMHQLLETVYAEGIGWRAVSLPYDGGEVSMLVVLPDAGRFEAIAPTMTADRVNTIFDSLTSRSVSITLPKFEIRTTLRLADRLAQMGMPSAFSEDADFSRMDGSRSLVIADVIHQAFVKVNEAGTEAAAATAVGVGIVFLPEYTPFEATRPFLFFIVDNETRALLFAGQVVDPT